MIRGGAQENTLLSLIAQRDLGHEVRLITGPSLGPEGDMLTDLADAEIDYHEIPTLLRAVSPVNDYKAYRELQAEIKEFKPDVVHTHSSKAGVLGRFAAWKMKVPAVVHTIHGLPFHPFQNPLINYTYILAEKVAAKKCHRIVSVCDTMSEKALAEGVGIKKQFSTVYSGMHTEIFTDNSLSRDLQRERFGIIEGDFVICKVARLFELKGHDYLFSAFLKIKDKIPEAKLLLVGDGNLREELERMAEEMGFTERIIWTGLLHPNDVPAAISASDMLVHCSLREGLARVLPQGLLAGKPVVSFDIDGAREVVINEKTGYLIEPEDIEGLANAILEIRADYQKALELANAGKELCMERFDWRFMGRRLVEVYSEVLSRENS